MNTVVMNVGGLDEALERLREAFKGKAMGARISFATPELLLQVMTQKRWDLLRKMVGRGEMTIRQAARRVERDVKAVHSDVHVLLNAGVLRKTDRGQIVFPFDAVHADFTLTPSPDEDDDPERKKEDVARVIPRISGKSVSLRGLLKASIGKGKAKKARKRKQIALKSRHKKRA
jgi:predicted transcriptional regulator